MSRTNGLRVLAALLAVAAAVQVTRSFTPRASIDFYQFAGVSAARAQQPGLGLPWTEPDAYREALEKRFGAAPDPEVRRVHRVRMRAFEPFGSPLLYLAFAPLPDDYRSALLLYRALQVLAFAAGVSAWTRLAGGSLELALVLPGALLLLYRPLGDDLLTGNLNALQLCGLALGVRWARQGGHASAAALLLVAALALVKANLALAALGVGAAIALRDGRGALLRAGAAALPGVLLLLLAPALYFGSASVWTAWWGRVFAQQPDRLTEYAVAAGNTSTPRLLEETLGVPALASSLLLAALLGLSLWRLPRTALARPAFAAGLGVVAMLAVSPLVWFHYFVLALAPGLWLALGSRAALPRALAVATLLVLSAFYLPVVPRAALPALHAIWSLAWIPLWCALLLRARAMEETS